MSTPQDDPSLEAYRAASGALDEQPSAAARAAILAAAAREVQAKPLDAASPLALAPIGEEHIEVEAPQTPQDNVRSLPHPAAPASVRRPRPAAAATADNVREFPAARRRSRWPLAAAASVLVASLAVMLAGRSEKDTAPSLQPPAEVVARAPAAEPPAASVAPTPAVAAPSASASAEPAPAPMPQGTPAPATLPAPSPSRSVEPPAATTNEKRTEAAELAAAPPPAVAARSEAAAAADAAGAPVAQRAAQSAESPAAAARAPLGAAASAPRAKSDLPDDWIARIIELRRAGRDDEAEAELRRFRERYPHIPVPASALPRTGTR
jgi:hypothetical protein